MNETTPQGLRCSACKQTKGPDEFGPNRARPTGLNNNCRECARVQRRAWKAKNPDKVRKADREAKSRDRAKRLRTWRGFKYGLTAEAFAALVTSQGHACAICRTPFEESDRTPHIDHDHTSGKVRGVLCFGCNAGLGQFRDNPDALLAAHQYLITNKE